jgi:hypothetical protein
MEEQRVAEWRQKQQMELAKFAQDKQGSDLAQAQNIQKTMSQLANDYLDSFDIVDEGDGNVTAHQPPGGFTKFLANRKIGPDSPYFSMGPAVGAGALMERTQKVMEGLAKIKDMQAQAQQRLTPKPEQWQQVQDENGEWVQINKATGETRRTGVQGKMPKEPTPHFSFVQGQDEQGNPSIMRGNTLTGDLQPTGTSPIPKTGAAPKPMTPLQQAEMYEKYVSSRRKQFGELTEQGAAWKASPQDFKAWKREAGIEQPEPPKTPQVMPAGAATAAAQMPQPGGRGKLTDKNIAARYVQAAGGDKQKARQLAMQDGWSF